MSEPARSAQMAQSPPADERDRLAFLFPTCVFLIALVPLLVTPVIPTIDYYNHVARYYVLGHLDAEPALQANYAAAWGLLPNLGLDVLALPLFRFLAPLIAAKIVLILILGVQFSGALALNAALNGRVNRASVLLSAILLNSFIFIWGFANFLLGAGLAFWALAAWTTLRQRKLWLAALAGALFSVVIFLCHGFAFALYGLVLSMLEFGRWLKTPARRLTTLLAAALAVAAQAILPAMLFLNTATIEAGHTIREVASRHMEPKMLLDRLVELGLHQLTAIVRVANSPWLMLDAVSFVAMAALLFVAVRKGVFRINALAVPALLLLGVMCVLTPPSLFGVGKISDRIPLIAALMLTAALTPAIRSRTRSASVIVAVLGAIFLIRTGANAAGFASYRTDFADFREVAQKLPKDAVVGPAIPQSLRERDVDTMRCEMYPPLLVPLRGNPTPLFSNPSQQPLRLRGALAQQTMAAQRKSPGSDDLEPDGQSYRYILACGYQKVDYSHTTLLAQHGRFMLLERK